MNVEDFQTTLDKFTYIYKELVKRKFIKTKFKKEKFNLNIMSFDEKSSIILDPLMFVYPMEYGNIEEVSEYNKFSKVEILIPDILKDFLTEFSPIELPNIEKLKVLEDKLIINISKVKEILGNEKSFELENEKIAEIDTMKFERDLDLKSPMHKESHSVFHYLNDKNKVNSLISQLQIIKELLIKTDKFLLKEKKELPEEFLWKLKGEFQEHFFDIIESFNEEFFTSLIHIEKGKFQIISNLILYDQRQFLRESDFRILYQISESDKLILNELINKKDISYIEIINTLCLFLRIVSYYNYLCRIREDFPKLIDCANFFETSFNVTEVFQKCIEKARTLGNSAIIATKEFFLNIKQIIRNTGTEIKISKYIESLSEKQVENKLILFFGRIRSTLRVLSPFIPGAEQIEEIIGNVERGIEITLEIINKNKFVNHVNFCIQILEEHKKRGKDLVVHRFNDTDKFRIKLHMSDIDYLLSNKQQLQDIVFQVYEISKTPMSIKSYNKRFSIVDIISNIQPNIETRLISLTCKIMKDPVLFGVDSSYLQKAYALGVVNCNF